MGDKLGPNIIIDKCSEAGISFWLASKVAIKLKDSITTKTNANKIDKLVIEKLNELDSLAANQYKSHHSVSVRTSKNTIEPFTREKIIQSIVKEIKIPRITADEIAKEVENDIRRLQLKNISAPLVREMVNINLLEKRMNTEKLKYTRIGLPVYDISEIMGRETHPYPLLINEEFGNSIMQEYILTRILPQSLSNTHLNADLHIHRLHSFITSPISFQNDISIFLKNGLKIPGIIKTNPAKSGDVAFSHIARATLASKKYVSGGISIDYFNILLAPYIKGASKTKIDQFCQTFIYEINQEIMEENAITINMNTKIPSDIGNKKAVGKKGNFDGYYKDYHEESQKLLEAFIEIKERGFVEGGRFKWPIINIIRDEKYETKETNDEMYYTKGPNLVYGNSVPSNNLRGGMLQGVSINALKLAFENNDENKFYDSLEVVLEKANTICWKKRDLILKRIEKEKGLPFLTEEYEGETYSKFDRYYNVIGYEAIPQAVKILSGNSEFTKSELNLVERILRFTKKKTREFQREHELKYLLGEIASQDAYKHFNEHNKRYNIQTLRDKIVPKEAEKTVFKKIQPLCDAGLFYESNNVDDVKELSFVKLVSKVEK